MPFYRGREFGYLFHILDDNVRRDINMYLARKIPTNSKVKLELATRLPAVCCKAFSMLLRYQIMLLKSVGH